jgi:molybdenum cofactor cytidylyltransferase
MKKRPIAGIILAAGMSTRFGKTKQLHTVGDSTILSMVIDAALKSDLDIVVLVLGHESEAIKASLGSVLANPRLITVINQCFQEGMSTSLKRGLREINDEFPSVMILMGDQPLLSHEVINLLIRTFKSSDKDICVPVYNGKRGLPVCFTGRFYDEMMCVVGDMGAREIIRNNPSEILAVEIYDSTCCMDIDEKEDVERLEVLLNEINKRIR